MLQVKVKKLDINAILPKYNNPGDSGMDFYTPIEFALAPGCSMLIPLDLAFELPEGYGMNVRPTSGNTVKTSMRVQLGTVDNGYRGNLGIMIDNIGKETIHFERGRKIAQGVLVKEPQAKIIEVDELSESVRGNKGYGSSDHILGHK